MRRRHKGLVLVLAVAMGIGAYLVISDRQPVTDRPSSAHVIKDSVTRETKRSRPLDWVFPTFNVRGIGRCLTGRLD